MRKINRLEMRGIGKRFGGQYANKDVSLSVSSGEVLGLLGENGAGKTTLMNILYGLYRPDEGEILIDGERVRIRSPRESIQRGIGMIHQHFMLVEQHSVIENIVLGYPDAPFLFPERKVRERMAAFAERYGLRVDPDKRVWELSVGEQQRVEILKALFLESDLLIMDEPTSVLTPKEADELFEVIGRMKAEGLSVILISHKLEEIMANCDRVTVLRKGRNAGEARIGEVDERALAAMMVGREVELKLERAPVEPGETILELQGLEAHSDRGLKAVDGVSFEIREGQIFGIAGVSGNGQRELVEAVTGLRRVSAGRILLRGQDIANKSARVVNALGVTHVPEERIRFGIVPNLLVYENAVLKHHRMHPFSKILFLDYDAIRDHAMDLVERYNVQTPGIDLPMKGLSGGNIQKLILGRELKRKPPLLVASHPTYGLDVGATEFIRRELLKRREEGGAILLVSEDLEELFALCDKVGVLFKGRLMGVVDPRASSVADVGLMMAGIDPGAGSGGGRDA
jgi:simple sugar transport system ATP-binding protein